MKRILINTDNFLLPEKCSRCPFILLNQYGAYCRLTEYNIDMELEYSTKHEWCPLKEVEYNESY